VLSEADRFLLEAVRGGEESGWARLVDRYQGRLLAFARGQLRSEADAEDAVQDTLVSFLTGLGAFNERASLETYLFSILRRKIVDNYRRKRLASCSLSDSVGGGGASGGSSAGDDGVTLGAMIGSDDMTASWYVRRDESQASHQAVLAEVLGDLVGRLKKTLNFEHLRVAELVFYAQLRNKKIAQKTGLDEKRVALIKHRFIERIAKGVSELGGVGSSELADSTLTQVWESLRPSCLKRSTIGAWRLGTLDADWHDYVSFHIEELGCRFCAANLRDIERAEAAAGKRDLASQRLMQSTIGFLSRVDAP
jgi:RNA polymerase sigma factor (sigma-70 family)